MVKQITFIEVRKVLAAGQQSLAISIPVEACRDLKLKKGDSVRINAIIEKV